MAKLSVSQKTNDQNEKKKKNCIFYHIGLTSLMSRAPESQSKDCQSHRKIGKEYKPELDRKGNTNGVKYILNILNLSHNEGNVK